MATLADLRAAQNPTHGIAGRPMLHCQGYCNGEFSADPCDYFWKPEGEHFECCGRKMRLVRKRTRYVAA